MQGIDADLALRIVRESPVIAYDTETNGLDFAAGIVGYVITCKEHSIYVPVAHEGGGNIPDPDSFAEALNDAFAERSRLGYLTVGHNLGFDLRMSFKAGVFPWSPLEDTQINEALINDITVGYSLEDCSKRHGVTVKLGADLYAEIARRFGGLPDRKSMQHFFKMPGDHPLVVDYATGDGISTLELWGKQQGLLDAEELRKPWQLECDLLPYLAQMHVRGLKVDEQYAVEVGDRVKKGIQEAEAKFEPGFNSRSPNEVMKMYLANGYKEEDFARTDAGKPSFTEKWLKTNEIGNAILDIRRLQKARDSFIAPLVETKNFNGRVHPTLNQSKSDEYGVAGSRLSCSDPNLQAFPKRNKQVGKLVRPLIRADDDMEIWEADASQQEPRLFTHYSEESVLVEGYRNNTADMHDRASEYLRLERDVAKRLGLGMLTMMSPKTLAMHMDWPLADAKTAHAKFLTEAFPAIGKFQQTAVNVFLSRGFVKSILGRRARLESRRFGYKAVSRIIQNSAGEHLKTCLLRACQFAESEPSGTLELLMSIHDSLLGQNDKGRRHRIVELMKIVDNVPHEPDFSLIVPIPFEFQVGPNWGAASYGEKMKTPKDGWLPVYLTGDAERGTIAA